MQNKLFKIILITIILLALAVPNSPLNQRESRVLAGDLEIPKELLLEPYLSEFPLEPSILGRIEGTGIFFEIKNSEYLDIALKSSEEIKVVLESIPRMISLHIEGISRETTFTQLTLSGLESNKTYYKYQDSYKNEAIFVSDGNGNYSWTQDLFQSHHIWFQEIKGTTFIDKDTVLDYDITGSVEITANNITLDCNNHSITGSGIGYGGYGVYLNNKTNTIIKNCKISNFGTALNLTTSANNNQFIGNDIFLNYRGISSWFWSVENNFIRNNIFNNTERGIWIYSPNNYFFQNNISDNEFGFSLEQSGNYLRNNVLSNNEYNFGVWEFCPFPFCEYSNIDTSNTINDKPIYYLVREKDKVIDSSFNPGYIGLVSSTNITIKDITITNNFEGIYLLKTTNSKIENARLSNNLTGIKLSYGSDGNSIIGNNISGNSDTGVRLEDSFNNNLIENNFSDNGRGIYLYGLGIRPRCSFYNRIYHNNFKNNQYQIINGCGLNYFDNGYPSGGNYWSDYTGVDLYKGPNQDQPGSDGIGDTPYAFYGGQDRYPFMRESGWGAPPPQLPDLSITEIKPVQVVWEPDINSDDKIDLVAGKSTMVRVEVEMKDYEVLDKQQSVEVRLTFDGTDYTESRTIEQLEQNKRIEFYPAFPSIIGDQTIIARVDPEDKIEESDETNNENSTGVTVKETKGLDILYVKVNSKWPANYGAPEPEVLQNTAGQSTKFIQATYPIHNQGVLDGIYPGELLGSAWPPCLMLPEGFMLCVAINLDLKWLAKLSIKTGWDKVIGVVSDAYFPYHDACPCDQKCAIGVANPNIESAVLVQGDYYTVAAHEIGHTYGLPVGQQEEYKVDLNTCTTTYKGNPANGYWVEEKKDIENSICFMGTAAPKGTLDRWVCPDCYSHLFNQIKKGSDPEYVLLIDGVISANGDVELGKWYYLEDREIEAPSPGDYSIVLIDENGGILEEVEFDASFFMYIEPFGAIETDSAPFVFAIPYPENTSKLQIWHNEEMLMEINPNSKLLRDAVDLIPDYGFINNPEQRRNALHNKIEAVEKMIEQDNFKGAVNKLKFDIKDKFEKWLIDDYELEDPLQLSKEEIIELVNRIMDRLTL